MKAKIILYISLLLGSILSQSFSNSNRYLSEDILQKGQKQTIAASEGGFIFNCGDFKDGEEMYFKIKAESYTFYFVEYQFTDADHASSMDFTNMNKANFNLKSESETIGNIRYSVQYFTIVKDKSKFNGTKGNWLIINFYVGYGNVILENTLEDEGKFETWKIVVIVVAIVLVIAVVIGCYCYRRKKQLAMQNQNAAAYPAQTVGVNQYNNNCQYNQQYDPNLQYNQPVSNYDVNQQYNQNPANYDPNQQYNQPVGNYGQQY